MISKLYVNQLVGNYNSNGFIVSDFQLCVLSLLLVKTVKKTTQLSPVAVKCPAGGYENVFLYKEYFNLELRLNIRDIGIKEQHCKFLYVDSPKLWSSKIWCVLNEPQLLFAL